MKEPSECPPWDVQGVCILVQELPHARVAELDFGIPAAQGHSPPRDLCSELPSQQEGKAWLPALDGGIRPGAPFTCIADARGEAASQQDDTRWLPALDDDMRRVTSFPPAATSIIKAHVQPVAQQRVSALDILPELVSPFT